MPLLSSLVTSVGCHRILRFTTGIFLLLLLVLGMPAEAATYVVSNLNDSGAGSLRQAIIDADAHLGDDTIVFTVSGTIALSDTLHTNTNDTATLTIDGAGHMITVSGGGNVRVMTVDGGSLTLKNLTLADGNGFNGGAIDSDGTLTVINCTFINNHAIASGGAIHNNYGDSTIVNSTFSGNSAPRGGGIYNEFDNTVTLTNSTFANNSAALNGSSIFNDDGIVNLQNTIIADSSGHNCAGSPAVNPSSGVNLSTDTSCGAASSSLIIDDPGLLPLANNGGWTQTMALPVGSPAIDAADNAICAAAPVNNRDQRYAIRPYNSICDIGAYEYGASFVTATPIPTLSEWALLMLSGLLGLSVIVTLRRQSPANWRA